MNKVGVLARSIGRAVGEGRGSRNTLRGAAKKGRVLPSTPDTLIHSITQQRGGGVPDGTETNKTND